MRLLITKHGVGRWAAHYLCKKISNAQPTATKPFVLGLPTGSTPLDMYKELIKLYQMNKLSFKNVITFNMDEYVGLSKEHLQSYNYYMHKNFFDHIDINRNNVHILNGNAENLEQECLDFESKIKEHGGIDLMFGGVGEDGHIAFNEPGSSLNSITRVKTLNHSTIVANARFFNHSVTDTPKLALTMGIKTIMDAKEVVILAKGVVKSTAVYSAIEGAITSMSPVSALQLHNKAVVVCDEHAAYELKLKTIRYFDAIEDDYSLIENKIETKTIK